MQLYKKKEDCYGCGACMNICPKGAIKMCTDEQGFLYPEVDNKLCVNCGLCKQCCQIGKEEQLKKPMADICYGVKNLNEIRFVSSSGGVFSAITDNILKYGGSCVGVIYDTEMNVIHDIAWTEEERNLFRGSKYVQSNMKNIYKDIERILKEGKILLFTGTPCQIMGLLKYLFVKKISVDKLICLDIVCHGVPSPKIWKDHIKFIEDKYHSTVSNYIFRDKTIGWKGYHVRVELEDGRSISENHLTRSFVKLFEKDVMVRPSCFFCPYASMKRCGDITIGDFWGIENIDSEFMDNIGVSMVLVNTEKGKRVFESSQKDLLVKKYPTNLLIQPNLRKPTDYGKDYEKFWTDYHTKGYNYIAKVYGGYGCFRKIRYYINALKIRMMKY